jgi:transposase
MDTTKSKGRMTSVERDYKKSQGKDLFIKGFSIPNISEIIGVGIKTLSGWRDLHNWEGEKELNNIRPSEIKKLILQYVLDIKEGRTPKHKADDLAKISAAFDRLNDSRKTAVYTMESIDGFCQFMVVEAGQNTGKKRDELIELIKVIRPQFDKYVNNLLQND